nr:MAG TPA: hypothetical protein [Caudoviricetes sp.]
MSARCQYLKIDFIQSVLLFICMVFYFLLVR